MIKTKAIIGFAVSITLLLIITSPVYANTTLFNVSDYASNGITFVEITPIATLSGNATVEVFQGTSEIYTHTFNASSPYDFQLALSQPSTIVVEYNSQTVVGPEQLQWSSLTTSSSLSNLEVFEIIIISAIIFFIIERITHKIEYLSEQNKLSISGGYSEKYGGAKIRKTIQFAKKEIKDEATMNAYLDIIADLDEMGYKFDKNKVDYISDEELAKKINDMNENFSEMKQAGSVSR